MNVTYLRLTFVSAPAHSTAGTVHQQAVRLATIVGSIAAHNRERPQQLRLCKKKQ